jgi:arylsulfatase A-like enzyme
MYRHLALIVFLSAAAVPTLWAQNSSRSVTKPDDMDLYLLVGQSNMAGRGRVSKQDLEVHPRVFTLTKDEQWAPAKDPLHFDKPGIVGVGLGKTFALELAQDHPDRKIGLIPCAVGGSPIESWEPGKYYEPTKSHPYDDMLRRAQVAMHNGKLKGILWHQGESDSNAAKAPHYEEKLHALIKRIRTDLDAADVPFIAGQMGQFAERPWDEWKKKVDQVHRELPKHISNTAFVSSDGLAHKGDEIHFDAAGYRTLGQRYAAAFRLLRSKSMAVVPENSPMNFVFFLVDDLGWADLGCFGSTFHETPHLDRLCASGMKFNYGYAACPVCSPTRASILTGRHPVRVDITDWIPGQTPNRNRGAKFQLVKDRDSLALEEVTLAEVLKKSGYQTFFAGKWHLGGEGFWPTDQGFDYNIGGCDKGSPPGGYYAPWKNPNLEAKDPEEYLTERLTAESLKFLDERDRERPFLLYLSYYNVHTPITPYTKRIEHFRDKAKEAFTDSTPVLAEHDGLTRARQDNADYASMVTAVDDSVGTILEKLDTLGLSNNTAVFFFADNGGLSTLARMGPTCNLPLRAGKGWLYEGGVRVPMIVRVPGLTPSGSISNTPVVSMDFFPTMLELAHLPQQPNLHRDGESLIPLLSDKEAVDERTLYWHYPHYHGSTWTPGASIREGDWKLIDFYHLDKVELYNLTSDPGEQQDIGANFPEKRDALLQKLHHWQTTMQARMPTSWELE